MGDFGRLVGVIGDNGIQYQSDVYKIVLCPDLGGRIFAELMGMCPYRIDIDAVTNPTEDFNNYGGGNFWPAPEGGNLGFNYRGDDWYVQPAINNEPFRVVDRNAISARIEKDVALTNRVGTVLETRMSRTFTLCDPPDVIQGYPKAASVTWETSDNFEVMNQVTGKEALIASWTLDQFDATDDTIAFCAVEQPRHSINFDFYDPPHDRLTYRSRGFTYRVDGSGRGQIGVRLAARPSFIGFYDLSRGLLCLRENLNIGDGTYFNIADNDQPNGPYSAADSYSIFNSDSDMKALELETIGGCRTDNSRVTGSLLVSRTTLSLLEQTSHIERFLTDQLGE